MQRLPSDAVYGKPQTLLTKGARFDPFVARTCKPCYASRIGGRHCRWAAISGRTWPASTARLARAVDHLATAAEPTAPTRDPPDDALAVPLAFIHCCASARRPIESGIYFVVTRHHGVKANLYF